MARGRRLWMPGADGLKVYACNTVDEGENYATFDPKTNVIEVANGYRAMMEVNLFHELVHKALDGLPWGSRVAVFGETSGESYEKQEEALCECLEQRLFPILKSNGWLRFPVPPKPRR